MQKLHLKSECEKEIEEVTAQIQKKYETKLQESETEFDLRKKDLDVNYSKVLMNKILAEAFRWKYNDSRTCGKWSMLVLICSMNITYISYLLASPCLFVWLLPFLLVY